MESNDVIAPSSDAQDLPTQQDPDDAVLDVLSEEETATEPEQTKEVAKFRVKIDGTEREATLDELVSGYQKATAADERFRIAAEHRKQAEEVQKQAEQARSQYQQRLEQFVPDQVQKLQALQAELNTLATDDPAQWVVKKQQFDAELMKLNHAEAERQRMHVEREQAQERSYQETIAREREALSKAIPEWKDEAKAKTERSQIREFLLKNGYDEKTVDNVVDHRAVVLARKAMLYENLMAKVASRKAAPAEQTAAPSPISEVKSRAPVVKDMERMSTEEWMKTRNKQIRAA